MKAISLFTGIGGFDLAFKEVFNSKPLLMCECDPKAITVLRHRFPDIPVVTDIQQYQPTESWQFKEGIVYGGFPCTQTSLAGKRTGLNGENSKLWFDMLRIIETVKPKYALIEQPAGIIHNGLRAILGGLRMAGYSWEVEILSASKLGSPQRRERVFIIAYSDDLSERIGKEPIGWAKQIREYYEKEARFNKVRRQTTSRGSQFYDGIPFWLGGRHLDGYWKRSVNQAVIYPGMRKRTKGRVDCINLYGKAVTPQQAAIAFSRIKYLDDQLQKGAF